MIYTLVGSSEVRSVDESHCFTGIRLVISANEEMLSQYKIKVESGLSAREEKKLLKFVNDTIQTD
ncbi:MAG: hypothetical protein JKY54_12895 [Flavobacteriales bacterium]|nr:hypothetical protein [Flavobacteriales bacterium]